MRRKNLGNGIVKRAVMGAMATMITFTTLESAVPAVVYADVVLEDTVQNNEEEKTTVELIGEADQALGQAIGAEELTRAEAILTIGEGIITEETKAVIAEYHAQQDLEDATDAITEGENTVADDLADMKDAIAGVEEAAQGAAENKQDAQDAAESAQENLDGANNSTTSSQANEFATAAGNDAQAAKDAADEADAQAEAAKQAYEDAVAAYEQAVADADVASKLANEKIADASSDAAQAVADAKLALEKADALQKEMEDKKVAAKADMDEKEQAAIEARAELAEATKALAAASLKEVGALGKTATTGAALDAANKALDAANKALDAANTNVAEKEQAIEELKQAKADAEKAIADLEDELEELKAEQGADAVAVAEKEKELAAAKAAIDAANSALSSANADLAIAKKNLDDANTYLGSLSDDDYEKAVIAIEQKLNDASKREEGETEETLTRDLVSTVIAENFEGDITYDVVDNMPLYTVKNGEKVKYYSYEISEDGQIDVYEYSMTTETVTDAEATVYNTKAEFDAAVSGKIADEDYEVVYQEAVETTYDISYVAHEQGVAQNLSGREAKKLSSLPEGAILRARDWKDPLGLVPKALYGIDYFTYTYKNGTWICDQTGHGIKSTDAAQIYYPTALVKNVNGLTQSQLSGYSNYTIEKTNPGVSESWSVKFKTEVTHYAKTDSDVDASQANISKQISDATDTRDAFATAVSGLEKTISDITDGYTDENKVYHKSYAELESDALEAGKALDAAIAEKEDADQKVADAEKKLADAQATYDDYYKGQHHEILGGLIQWDDASEYENDLNKAKAELASAKSEQSVAQVAVIFAQAAQQKAAAAHEKAVAELAQATKELLEATIAEGKAVVKVANKEFDLAEARAEYLAAVAADAYATDLEKKAQNAYDAAVAAQEKVDSLLGTANVSAQELADAQKELEDALAAYEQAKADAEDARTAADTAQSAYEDALARVQQLIAAESANTYVASNEEPSAFVLVDEMVPAAATAPATTATATGRTATANNAAVEEQEISDEDTPLVAGDQEEEDVVSIDDEDSPLAVSSEKSRWNWWWLLIVAACGAAGVYVYEHNKKKQAQTNVESDKDSKN
ncbi:MAG: hypothetical protein PUB52_05625 [Lachnospiraceae bacterium]|nr:hypothetical protein [Lachnospiraceae bacterium]